MQPIAAQFTHVSKTFESKDGSVVNALNDVTFDIHEHEFLSIVGPSGCGKTTIMKILAGLIEPTTGEVLIDGKPIVSKAVRVGMVFQSPVLMPWLSVLSNIMLPVNLRRLDKDKFLPRARELIQVSGLEGFEQRFPFELSGGMQQRVSICRALLIDPEFLLMDEPFGALDAMTREKMGYELLRIWEGSHKTVVFITHSIPEAVFLADRVAVMTPRPGTVKYILNVNLSRPRRLSMMGTEEFGRHTSEVRNEIGGTEERGMTTNNTAGVTDF